MNSKTKYLKYKLKYITLKNTFFKGGALGAQTPPAGTRVSLDPNTPMPRSEVMVLLNKLKFHEEDVEELLNRITASTYRGNPIEDIMVHLRAEIKKGEDMQINPSYIDKIRTPAQMLEIYELLAVSVGESYDSIMLNDYIVDRDNFSSLENSILQYVFKTEYEDKIRTHLENILSEEEIRLNIKDALDTIRKTKTIKYLIYTHKHYKDMLIGIRDGIIDRYFDHKDIHTAVEQSLKNIINDDDDIIKIVEEYKPIIQEKMEYSFENLQKYLRDYLTQTANEIAQEIAQEIENKKKEKDK